MKIISSARIKSKIREHLIQSFPEIQFHFFCSIDEVGEELVEADVLITYGEDLTDEHIAKAKNLKWIMVISAGIDKLPFASIQQKNILVTNAKGIHVKPMAEYTMAMILQVARKAKTLFQNEQEAIWDRRVPMTEINGQTITIIGAGTIGTEIGRIAKAFDMKTIGVNRSGKIAEHMDKVYAVTELKEAVATGDYIVNVLPLTNETYHLLNKDIFSSMKNSAVFINIGRGPTVCEQDLIDILNEGKIAHAVLDVFEQEPLPTNHPFWKMENVTVTPHLSGISPHYQPRAFAIFEKNLRKLLNGETDFLNVVDLSRGY